MSCGTPKEAHHGRSDYRQYVKAIVALVAAVIVAIATALGNGEIGDLDGSDWVSIILTILGGTALVWFVENIQGVAGGIIKAVIAALTAAVTALETGYFDGGISQGELLTAIGAFAATLALTYQIPNAEPETWAAVVPTVEVGGTTKQTPTSRRASG